jgi:hypothetical protein
MKPPRGNRTKVSEKALNQVIKNWRLWPRLVVGEPTRELHITCLLQAGTSNGMDMRAWFLAKRPLSADREDASAQNVYKVYWPTLVKLYALVPLWNFWNTLED